MKHNQLSGAIAATPEGRVINDLFSARAHVTSGQRGDTQVGPVVDPVRREIRRTQRVQPKKQGRKR